MSMSTAHKETVAIVGAGLVGTLLAIFLARRGYQIDLYERRSDPRKEARPEWRPSINLTLSERGLRVLDQLGIGSRVRRQSVAAYGRIVHTLESSAWILQPYGTRHEALHAITRHDLNNILLNAADEYVNIHCFFDTKCVRIDPVEPLLITTDEHTGETAYKRATVVFAADGAFSLIRRQLLGLGMMEASQQLLDEGYVELTVPASVHGDWTDEKNALHIWPRGNYMLIGFANADQSIALTLHLPFQGPVSFEAIRTADEVEAFFARDFPDALPCIPALKERYCRQRPNTMVTVNASPWVVCNHIALIGDAAHAIVPHYGQGANAGFEDCALVDSLLERYDGDWERTLQAYQRMRKPHTDVIAMLALEHCVTLQAKTPDPQFILRSSLEQKISRMYPDVFVPLYALITFSELPYLDALRTYTHRQHIIETILQVPQIEEKWHTREIEDLIHGLIRKEVRGEALVAV